MTERPRTLVIGVGHRDRGDDAVGRVVADALRDRVPSEVDVVSVDGDGGRLLDLLGEADFAIVVDAAMSGADPGTVMRLDAVAAPLPPSMFAMSTHAIGLADSVELARTLSILPSRCLVYAIEAERFDLGAGLSPAVAAAVDVVVSRVLQEL